MGGARDDQVLASEVLGIRGASAELARRLVAQALVVEDRREAWRAAGDRICRAELRGVAAEDARRGGKPQRHEDRLADCGDG